MNAAAGYLALSLALLGIGTYRYGIVFRLLAEKPGFVGLTVFTGLLFLPSVTAFVWRGPLERRGRLGTFAVFVGVCWLTLAIAAQKASAYAAFWGIALTLGVMEALLLPALQSWFAESGDEGLARGMSALFALTCLSLFASPVLLRLSAPVSLPVVGLAGTASLLAMIFLLERKQARGPRAPAPVVPARDRSILAVLFLCGVALGSLSNMIYPIALRVLKLEGSLIGLYVCVPMLAASAGAGLRSRLGGRRDAWALGAACALPLIFLSPYPQAFLPVMFAWGVCLGFAESGWLARHDDFTSAMSFKYVGVASGIVLSGAVAELGVGPIATVGVGFYALLFLGGIVWAAC